MCGTDWAELTEGENAEQVLEDWEETGWERFWPFNREEDFDDVEPELDMLVEEYDPEKHDGILN